MTYPAEEIELLLENQESVLAALQELYLQSVILGQSLTEVRSREHMLHGVSRRLSLLSQCIENVYRLFPPSSVRPFPVTGF